MAVSFVHAAIEVVEGQPTVVTGTTERGVIVDSAASGTASGGTVYSTSTRTNRAAPAELYVQLQALQVELGELRGIVEQQAYLIEQLSQRRMDDYRDLDRRMVELQQLIQGDKPLAAPRKQPAAVREPVTSGGPATAAAGTSKEVYSTADTAGGNAVPDVRQADDAREMYSAAYQLVKDREFGKAKVALGAFIKDFPGSDYVPNAYFWLGELYYLDSSLEKSRDAFEALVTGHGKHRKVSEAKFKLGKIYHQLGDVSKAKSMLESVLADHPDSTAVNPAREYLKNSL
ncbi:MAG: tol-pal system protein YbgF [Pseudomonadales bacterium]